MSEPTPCRHFMLSGARQADGTVRYRCHTCLAQWQVRMSDTSMFPERQGPLDRAEDEAFEFAGKHGAHP